MLSEKAHARAGMSRAVLVYSGGHLDIQGGT